MKSCPDVSAPRTHFSRSWSDSFGDVPEALPAKQSVWDLHGVVADRALVESNLSTSFQLASFRAASSPHSGDWLFVLPISPCGLCLDDEAVRIAVSVRLGRAICVPHKFTTATVGLWLMHMVFTASCVEKLSGTTH